MAHDGGAARTIPPAHPKWKNRVEIAHEFYERAII